jgi:hypothetical protein
MNNVLVTNPQSLAIEGAYRQLALTILGLDVRTLTAQLRVSRGTTFSSIRRTARCHWRRGCCR